MKGIGIDKEIVKILGESAIGNNMDVPKDIQALSRCLLYLHTQIQITAKWCDQDGQDHVNYVLKITKEMLSEF